MSRPRDQGGAFGGNQRLLAASAFGVFGGLWGVWAVLLVDLIRVLDLSTGMVGFALSGGVLASIPAMVLGGRAADRWGHRGLIVLSGASMSVSFAGLAFVGGYASFMVVLLLWCVTSGIYDVGINAFALNLERITNRRIMAPVHAAFSGGGAAGALAAGALVAIGADYRYIYVGATLPVAVVVLAAAVSRFPHAPPPRADGPGGEKKAGLYRNLPLVLVGCVAALAFFSEGAMEDWSGVYLLQTLALPSFLGASGVAAYHASMAVGRLGADRAIRRFGNRLTLTGAGLLTAVGMALALATRQPFLVVVGFLVVGLALSATAPIAFSVAGDLVPDRAGAASSIVATVGYSGFLVGPVVVGGIAEFSGLRVSFCTVVLAGVLIATLAGRLEMRPPSYLRPEEPYSALRNAWALRPVSHQRPTAGVQQEQEAGK